MAGSIRSLLQAIRTRRVAARRARNLRAAAAPPRSGAARGFTRPRISARLPLPGIDLRAPALWIAVAGLLAAGAGAVVIARHAQSLALAVDVPATDSGVVRRLPALQALLPGALITVPADGRIAIEAHARANLLVLGAATRAAAPLRIDLCRQMSNASDAARRAGTIAPLRIGYRFEDVVQWVGDAAAPGLRAVALAGVDGGDMPKLQVSGNALGDGGLRLRWDGATAAARWIGDGGALVTGASGQVTLANDGWLVWRDDAAIHVQRQRGGAGCAAGQLLLQVVRSAPRDQRGAPGRGFVAAYPVGHGGQGGESGAGVHAAGAPIASWLAAADYQVPLGAAPGLEDQFLFEQLRMRGMLRLSAAGLAELVPRDLPTWRAAPATARAGELASWDQVALDDGGRRLLKRLYRMADGAYVREQVRIFNGERRLLAWRSPINDRAAGQWRADAGAAVSTAMPASATRLFADLKQGWQPWTRIDGWSGAADRLERASLSLTLARPAAAGDTVRLMLIGRAGAVVGATVRQRLAVCDGRACPAPDAAQVLTLELLAGATRVTIDATPLDMAVLAMPGDQQYRHLRVADGRLDWLPLPPAPAPRPMPTPTLAAPRQGSAAPAAVALEDRHGTLLWNAGAPTPAAAAAGLAPLLGIRADHAASIAGMLARLPDNATPSGGHSARLSIDLALQSASQRAVDCVGMRHGAWDGVSCGGGQAPPAGRHAGMVILDAETGDILAAAGAGGVAVDAANWLEVRNFDRSDPARSPLRLPALQHDGGAHASPGSTFKVISALGLEQAAARDPRIEALLAGMPLAAINRMARQREFDFQTDAATYPMAQQAAHITNYKGQNLDRRAVDGSLGLAQALTYSLNTWFAWTGELSDASLFGHAGGGVPDLQALEPGALDTVRPIVGMANRLGFGRALRLDGGLLPPDFRWGAWDALQASAANIDPIHSRHELRQMAIGLRMQVTPLQMALAASAVGQGAIVAPRLLLRLDGRDAADPGRAPVGVRLDRIRAGMEGVVDVGTAAGAFRDPRLAAVRRGLSGKTGTAPTGTGEQATVWFTGWLEPGSLPGQTHRLALAAFVSHSAGSGGEHAAPLVAAALRTLAAAPAKPEQKGK